MSHPGHGPDTNPSGQQPGQPVPPGQPYQPFDQQPGQPAGAWTPPGGASAAGGPQKGSTLKKVLPIVGGVVVLGVAASAFGLFGAGEPEVGDCIKGAMGEDVETVDCGSDEAEAKVVGVDEQEMTYDEFMATGMLCTEFATAQSAIWYGPEDENADGKIYCAEPV
ncbi:LppU/SCO3897 family protein [Blastococcus saxobsidens]|uniref:Uncharacterized protein n=1 Tax=Blastococcus saxobsidens TaxID=138336 RepID=A0A4Q7Y8R9_9ACTN|nr:hypothetical protein [Blastococcus saxobsidens]RZU32415.1 hypothetical protein BKA19_2110 [Blastococcus saxobsidens]